MHAMKARHTSEHRHCERCGSCEHAAAFEPGPLIVTEGGTGHRLYFEALCQDCADTYRQDGHQVQHSEVR